MKVLEMKNITLEYVQGKNRYCALKEINLTIDKGEFVTIVGPSGCGKSSLLGILAGTLIPTNGEAFYFGRRIEGPGLERGVMMQQATLYPWLTAMDNVAFGLKMQGIIKPERDRRAQESMRSVGLEASVRRYPYELSGGMKQRVALARTLVTNPEIVLMDEPLASVDAFTKRRMHELFAKLWEDTGKTFVMVTHDVDEAIRLGTKLIVMGTRPGRIIAQYDIRDREWLEHERLMQEVFGILKNEAEEYY